jgi:glycosyltransferase involved in cell wall biosynthesis
MATVVGDVPRLLAHTDTARLVVGPDADLLATELTAAIDRGKAVDERARRYIAAHHFPGAMAQAYAAVYASLTTNEHGRKAS